MFRVLYISCELQSCSFFWEFSLMQRIVLVFTAVLVEFSDSSSFSQFWGIDFFSFENSDIQLVFKDSVFNIKFSDNFSSFSVGFAFLDL